MKTLLSFISHPFVFALGAREFLSSFGMTYDNDPESPRSRSYDRGRDLMHRITLRKFE